MHLDITIKEQQILIELLEFRVRELHPTIRRSRVSAVTDELKHDLEEVKRLLEKIRTGTGKESESGIDDGLTIATLQPVKAAISQGGVLVDPRPYATYEEAYDALSELESEKEERRE